MNLAKFRKWIPVALCCLPGMIVAVVVIGMALSIFIEGVNPMEIQTLLLLIAALACPIGMGVMMWMMNRHASGGDMPGQHLSETERLKTLRERRRLLEQEIAETEKIVTLQAQKEVMADSQSADLLKG